MQSPKQERWSRWGKRPASQADITPQGNFTALHEHTGRGFVELRCFHHDAAAQARSQSTGSRLITGTCVPYEKPSGNVGGFREMFARGSFAASIAQDDIRALVNGNSGMVLGRKSAGTVRCWESAAGVQVEIDCPATSFGDDLLVSMRRGDIDQFSIGAYYLSTHWDSDAAGKIRVIDAAKLVFCSVTGFSELQGAMADTEAKIDAARMSGYNLGCWELARVKKASAAPVAPAPRATRPSRDKKKSASHILTDGNEMFHIQLLEGN